VVCQFPNSAEGMLSPQKTARLPNPAYRKTKIALDIPWMLNESKRGGTDEG
jgi:hypothetical protein